MRKALQCLVRHRRLGRSEQFRVARYRHAFNTSNASNAFNAFPCNPYLMKAKAAENSMLPWPAAKLKH
jgi:hypothetical protein